MSSRAALLTLLLCSGCAHPHLLPRLVTELSSSLDEAEAALKAGEIDRANALVGRAKQAHRFAEESGKGTSTQRREELQPFTARLEALERAVWKKSALRWLGAAETSLAQGDVRGAASALSLSAFARHSDEELWPRGEALRTRVEAAQAELCEKTLKPYLERKDAPGFRRALSREGSGAARACTEAHLLRWEAEAVRVDLEARDACRHLPALASLAQRARYIGPVLARVKTVSDEKAQACVARVAALAPSELPAVRATLANAQGLSLSPPVYDALEAARRQLDERLRQQAVSAREQQAAELAARVERGDFAGACTLARREKLVMPSAVVEQLEAARKREHAKVAERHLALAKQAGEAFPATAAIHARIARAHGAPDAQAGDAAASPRPEGPMEEYEWPSELVATAGCEPMRGGSLAGKPGYRRVIALQCTLERRERPVTVTVTEKRVYGGDRIPGGVIRDLNGNATTYISRKERQVEVTEYLAVRVTVLEHTGFEQIPVTVTVSYPWFARGTRQGALEFRPYEFTHTDKNGDGVSLARLLREASYAAVSRWVEAQASWARRATNPREREEAWARVGSGLPEVDDYFLETYGVNLKGPSTEVSCEALSGR